MFDDSTTLASQEARALFRDDFRALMRRGDVAGAEGLVAAHTRANDSLLGALSAAVRAGSVHTRGWKEVAGTLSWHTAERMPVIAIGIDFTGAVNGEEDARGCTEPGMETRYYTAQSEPALAGKRSQVETALAAAEGGCWQGAEESCETDVTVHGLAGLYTALLDAGHGEIAASEGDRLVGWATLALRFYQAVVAGAEGAQLPAGLIVISGQGDLDKALLGASGLHIVGEGVATASPPPSPSPSSSPSPTLRPLFAPRRPGGFGRKGL